MKTGLLWYDDSDDDLEAKVARAAQAYRAKYGKRANTCFVHPTAVDKACTIEGIRVEPKTNALLHHFWIGQETDHAH